MSITKKGAKRVLRVLLILLTIVIVFNEWLFAGALMYARREMLHEGATYSQWYEGSIEGYYFILFVFILHSELTLAVLTLVLRKNKWIKGKLEKIRKIQEKKGREWRWERVPLPRMLALCAVLAVMTGLTAYWYMQCNEVLHREIAAQEWPLAGRYSTVGKARILLLLIAQGFAASIYLLIRRRRDEKRSGKEPAVSAHAMPPAKTEEPIAGGEQIAAGAYANHRDLERMEIPEGVMQIGSYAFKDCTALREVSIPRSVHTIDRRAFSGCTALERIVLPKGLRKLGAGAFEKCSSLKEIDLGESLEAIEYNAFRGCSALCAIELPRSVKTIEFDAFASCGALERIHMPSVSRLGNGAMSGCKSLRSIVLPVGMSEMRPRCFAFCTALEEIEIPRSVKAIPEDAFQGCENLRRILLHSQIESISRYAFLGCDQLESIEGADLAQFALAFEHTPAYRVQYPDRGRMNRFPLELAGCHDGKTLRDRGFALFEEDREYSISRPGEDRIVVVSSWSSDEGPDEDGFGREEYYDWWLLDEELKEIPGIPMWHDYSHLDMRNSEKSWNALREQAAEIVRQRENV